MKKSKFRRPLTLLACFLLLFSYVATMSAQHTGTVIKGKVADVHKEPVLGATIFIKGTTTGTTTDLDGNFTITANSSKDLLVVSYLGYKTQEVSIKGKAFINIVMEEDNTKLDEVVVIGYASQTKATVTGALSTVDTRELIKVPTASVTNMLSGNVPGVSTVQTTGQPGADDAAIFIRGAGSFSDASSSPLILVDGVERSFAQIDPNEIENLSILKDASSTAVFGVRGANGVILVTTKRGKQGRPQVSVSSNTGVQQPMAYVQKAGSYEHARFWNMKQQNDKVTDPKMYYTREAIEAYRTGSDPIMYPNVDWGNMIFNDVFLQTKNNINISGGTEKARYFISFGYLYQNGVLKQFDFLPYDNNYKYNRYNYRANIDFDLTKSTKLKLNIGGHLDKTQEPRTTENINYGWTAVQVWSLPMVGPGIVNGKRTILPKGFVPGAEARDGFYVFYGNGYNQQYKTTVNMDAEITQDLSILTKGLTVSIKGSFDSQYQLSKYRSGGQVESQNVYYQSYLDDNTKLPTDLDYDKTLVFVPTGQVTPLRYTEDYTKDRNWYLEGRLDYKHTFGDHAVSGLLLYNQSRNHYPTGPTAPQELAYIPRSYLGVVGRFTYGYRGKYLFDYSMGYNGSENFAPGKNRFGFFPSVSGGWVVSEENFFKKQNLISYMKLRVSWGKVGNDLGSTRFMYMPAVWNPGRDYSFGINNPVLSEGYVSGIPGNRDVTWETASKQNYGIDMMFLNNRLTLNVDYFFEHRTGILLSPQDTPAVIATGLPDLNLGVIDNQGYEIALGWKDKLKSGFSYYVNANVSFARNKIINMGEIKNDYDYQNETGGSTGRQKGVYQFERLYQYSDFTQDPEGNYILNPNFPQPSVTVYPGDAMYADLNGDNIVNEKDKMVTGYPNRPEYMFGLNGGFEYKGFNFSMQWAGATNVNRVMEVDYRIPFTNAGSRGLLQYFYDDCWTPENQNGTLPRAAETSETWNSELSTLWLRDASYIRLKNLTVGYTFKGEQLKKKLGISSIGISFTGYNLLTFSPYNIMDPESVATNLGKYPLVKIYSLGLNVNF